MLQPVVTSGKYSGAKSLSAGALSGSLFLGGPVLAETSECLLAPYSAKLPEMVVKLENVPTRQSPG